MIVVDTETTGLWVNQGHRLVEIACIELDGYKPTGRTFHRYIFPKLDTMPRGAFDIHGISIEFLRRFPPFEYVVDDLLTFIGDRRMIMHNAPFDLGFLNAELGMCGRMPFMPSRCIDTLQLARSKFPGAAASLDALCKRFGIDLSGRKMHGAGIDCALLARVYFELTGGSQPRFEVANPRNAIATEPGPAGPRREPRKHPPLSDAEAANFEATLAWISDPIWRLGAIGNPPAEPEPVRTYKGFEI